MHYVPEEEFEQILATSFPPEVVNALVNCIQKGYDTGCYLHEPEKGASNSTFGPGIFEYTKHELKVVANSETPPFSIASEYPNFCMNIGSFTVANHRVGDNERQSIHSCFPNTDRAARTGSRNPIAPGQIALEGFLPKQEVPLNLVLSHLGNPDDGLCAVYICRPGHASKGKIVSWDYTNLLWKRDESSMPSRISHADLLGDEIVEKPVVRRKSGKATGDGG